MEMFVENIIREDRNVMDFVSANYTFVNERLAAHYEIPDVRGPLFRRVTLTDPNRFGLLGKGAVLMSTSVIRIAHHRCFVEPGFWRT